ncbi:hypothetical protein DSO57_1033123 [Entomophthora muscae]|uniref:Uncharacterized protein n=2 Tax=Entomophthora muscae TaxID=34485 RepID=A0ACC2TAY6_9FUNG|nr:hypothetical protein DSO57_1030682 [Entomophthora muscae]KAJ9071844.1 hypothetical protein DSO57_1033123 [Entomophthora muscae]
MRRKILGIVLVALAYSFAVVPHLVLFVCARLYKYIASPTLDGLTYILFTCISLINGIFPIFLHSEIKEIVLDMFSSKRNHSKFPYY